MALVTVQRSPSIASSPKCSISDIRAEEGESENHEKSECFFAGKGTALVLPVKDVPHNITERRQSTDSNKSMNSTASSSSDIQQHLQSMFYLLKHEETLKMAVKLESHRPSRTRYLAIVSRSKSVTNKEQKPMKRAHLLMPSHKCHCDDARSKKENVSSGNNQIISDQCSAHSQLNKTNDSEGTDKVSNNIIEESCLLGIDCNEKSTVGLVLRILADTSIRLDGDGGFSISVYGKTHIFKPVSVQAMWSALQTLHKVSQKARENNYYAGGPSHDWVSYYESRIDSDRSCLNEWNAMDAIESRRPPSPDAVRNKPTEGEETKKTVRMKLKEIMMSVDLDEVTAKDIRVRLEEHLDMDLDEYKSFIDEEMLTILGQMDAPTKIFDHVYLGSEWNASNLEELQRNGVRHILNVTREIDNFFPGMFDYCNVRVYDDERTNLLKHWDNTFKYISRAKTEGSKVLVHCKMGVSRSASVVIAYAMKAYNWDFKQALEHVKEKRSCIKPNKNFLAQLETYRGMLDAMKNKEKLQRSKSETNLKSVKDARLIPGSEPTPLIQALNHSRKCDDNDSSNYIIKVLRRSNSSSLKSIPNSIVTSKQYSQSLDNFTQNILVDEQKNVRYPGSNGQSYSVTQNQILHIQKNSYASSVKCIVNELESSDKKTKENRNSLNLCLEQANFNPISSTEINKNLSEKDITKSKEDVLSSKGLNNQIWAASIAQNFHQSKHTNRFSADDNILSSYKNMDIMPKEKDLFSSQLDHVFTCEEADQTNKLNFPVWTNTNVIYPTVSHQKSCSSSVDSVEGSIYPIDKRGIISRHSSWGSGDNKICQTGSWRFSDSNRSTFPLSNIKNKQQNAQPIVNTKKDPIWYPSTVKRTKQKLEEIKVFKKMCGEMQEKERALRKQKHPIRCNSEEIILSVSSNTHRKNQLSVSVPATFSIPSKNNENLTIKHNYSNLEKATTSQDKMANHVLNLKMSFEAKVNSNSLGKKGRSLPSSPIAPHNVKIPHNKTNVVESKDLSVKGLVNKYQSTESHSSPINCYRLRPRSFYESRVSRKTDLDINTKWIPTNQEYSFPKVNDFNRPPVPPSNLSNISMSEGIILPNCHKRVQQHGRTHPLAKLAISKQRLNTTAYNTM